jgi:hypothetical protein
MAKRALVFIRIAKAGSIRHLADPRIDRSGISRRIWREAGGSATRGTRLHFNRSPKGVGALPFFGCFEEVAMSTRFKALAVAAALAAGTSSAAMAQYAQPVPGYSNPVSGAASGLASGAASGNATAGPVGAVIGGALGTASGTLTGTANMLTPAPACGVGYVYYNGGCYPARYSR